MGPNSNPAPGGSLEPGGAVPGSQDPGNLGAGPSGAEMPFDPLAPNEPSPGETPTGPAGPSDPTGSTPAPIATPADGAACPTLQLAPSPLRRLTRFEYRNSVRDLLGVDPSAADELPVDEKITDGYSNNAAVLTVSALHAEKYVLVSEALAAQALSEDPTLAACDAAVGEPECALAVARDLGRRAFRRPTTPEDETALMAAYDAGRTGGSHAEGIEVMIRAALQSPHFLYRLETTPAADPAALLVPLSQYEIATRLSYLLWASGPDEALLDMAERGELATKEAVATQARAMLQDTKARSAIAQFYQQWLGTSRLDVTSKNQSLFPAFTGAVKAAMAAELPAFVGYVLFEGDHKLSTLLTSSVAFVNEASAPLYGVAATGSEMQMVPVPEDQGRAGVLTQAGFLAVQAHPDQTSPVLRGKTIRMRFLCEPLAPPPPDADITPPELDEGATARERFAAHAVSGSACNTCHQYMDPIGFAFENFDAIGQYRTTEGGRDIDATGEVVGSEELAGAFVGVRPLAEKLAQSSAVQNCVATEWFRYASGRTENEGDTCSLSTLAEQFAASDGDLMELIVATTQTDAFWFRGPAVEVVQ